MRFLRTSFLLILIVCLASVPALAAHHVNGTWVLTVDLGGQGGDATFELEEGEEGKLTGKYSGAVGQAEVTGMVNGNEVEFSFESDTGKVEYKGTVSGNEMKGTCTYGDLGEGTFEGSKQTE